jgi:GDP-L-fucose synthase
MTEFANRRVLVTGASGFMGRNLLPHLAAMGAEIVAPSHADFDLTEQAAVREMFSTIRPHIVFHLAGLVGGILANKKSPADYCQRNLAMGTQMIHEAWRAGVEKYITLIGGCSYPGNAPSPIAESELWNGYPQAESAPYSLAKRMMVVLAQAYRAQHGFNAIVLAPGNVYGPYDNFDLENSHVIPAMLRKYDDAARTGATEVVAWGTGKPERDFVYVDDACRAILIAASKYSGPDIINLSSGRPVTIRHLVETVARVVGYQGRVVWDETKPDGQMKKGFDVTRMREWLGVECETSLEDGLLRTYEWYRTHRSEVRLVTEL